MKYPALLVAPLCVSSFAYAQDVWITYRASLGTLPQSQCWQFNGNSSPAPRLADNAVEIGPSSYSGTQYYSREAYTHFASGAILEAEVYVINSEYGANPCGAGQRAGTYIGMTDDTGRVMHVGLGNNMVFITGENIATIGTSAPRAAVQTQGAWRTYRLEVVGTTAQLFVDGVLTLTCPTSAPRGTPRNVWFGDASVCGGGHARFRSVRVRVIEDCTADFNRDGFVDGFDYDDFVSCFEGDSCPCDRTADFNHDGFPDGFDYDDFVAAFEVGCL